VATTVRELRCPPAAVFRVLGQGWLYPVWVVGASRMRDVDATWPRAGARLHHSVGVWPALIDDTTTCVEWEPPHRMTMTARGWPAGEARVVIEVEPAPAGSVVRIHERAVRGPATLLPRALADPLLWWRNTETLRRLAFVAERMAATAPPDVSRPVG